VESIAWTALSRRAAIETRDCERSGKLARSVVEAERDILRGLT
jgi:hypothetical protein